MIAKLVTHAPTREAAIDAMSDALDAFYVDGIQHNVPFLTALMNHPRWRSGELATSFIADEYPDGFSPAVPDEAAYSVLAAVALSMGALGRERLDHLPGRLRPHSGAIREDWVVKLDKTYVPIRLAAGYPGTPIELDMAIGDGAIMNVESDWSPGDPLWSGKVGSQAVTVQVRNVTGGHRLDWQGYSVVAKVMTPRIAELDQLMPEKLPPDTSKMLLCPMPGLVVSIAVEEEQEIKAGEQLAVVEAMKMENVLRAERDCVVSAIKAEPGDSLAVDAVIMEFS